METATVSPLQKEDILHYLSISDAIVEEYQKGQEIYTADSTENLCIHYLDCGRVVTQIKTTKGKLIGLEILEADDVLGLEATTGRYRNFAVCTERSRIFSWPIESFSKLMQAKPPFAMGLFQLAIDRLIYYQRRIEQLTTLRVKYRIAMVIIEAAEKQKLRTPEARVDDCITLPPLTHETIASFIGSSRVLVTHQLNALRRAGYIDYRHSKIRILKFQELTEFAQNSGHSSKH